MNAMVNLAGSIWRRLVAWARALNQALTTAPPLETDGFARRDDGAIIQPRDF